MSTELHIYTKEKKDTIEIKCDINILKHLPLKIAMTTLTLLENNNRNSSSFVIFDKTTTEFINEFKDEYQLLLEKESPIFKKLNDIYLKGLKGTLYQSGNELVKIVSVLYENEKYFDNIFIPKIPKIIYALKKEKDSDCEKVLDIKNIDELHESIGKDVGTHVAVLFKDALNYEYQKENKGSINKPYGISSNIIESAWNQDLNRHEHLKSFDGKLYILTNLFQSESKKINDIDELAKLVYLQEQLRINVEKELKPKMKF